MPKLEFAIVGDNCIDRFLAPVSDCLVGGNAVNVAVQLAMLGRSVGYFGAVGDDRAGLAVRDALRAKGVNVNGLKTLQGQRTAYTDIEMSEDGDRTFVFEEFGASAVYQPSAADRDVFNHVKHVHIGWLKDGGALKHALRGSGVTISQDLGVNNTPDNLSPRDLDIAFCPAEPSEAEREARRLLEGGAGVAVVTMGAAGSLASNGSSTVMAPAPMIAPEDTTGAGDAFIAGFLDAYAEKSDLKRCLDQGTAQAAKSCTHRGGFPQTPLKDIFTQETGVTSPDFTEM